MNPLVSDLVFDTVVVAAIAVSLGAGVWQVVSELRVKREIGPNKQRGS